MTPPDEVWPPNLTLIPGNDRWYIFNVKLIHRDEHETLHVLSGSKRRSNRWAAAHPSYNSFHKSFETQIASEMKLSLTAILLGQCVAFFLAGYIHFHDIPFSGLFVIEITIRKSFIYIVNSDYLYLLNVLLIIFTFLRPYAQTKFPLSQA